jgi:hypothetical protein
VDLLARTCNYDVGDSERISARLFVGLGGLIWAVLAIGASVVYPPSAGTIGFMSALAVAALAVLAFVIGWFFENLAAILLFAGAVVTIVWGFMMGWEIGVWGLMAVFLIGPEIIAGLLFVMSARMQKACELEKASKA